MNGEDRKCHECGESMLEGERLATHSDNVTLAKKGDFSGDKIIPYYCRKCGFTKLYKEIKRRKLP